MEVIRPDPLQLDDGPLVRSKQDDWEFSAARELRDWVERLVGELAETKEWSMEPGELDSVFVGTFARGTKTFRAALLLCDRGYGEQAGMLNRSLYEHMVVAWWTSLQSDDEATMDKLRRHHDHARVLFERSAERHPDLGLEPGRGAEPLDDAYVGELNREFGNFGRQWHGKRLDELVREVEEGWEEPYPEVLWKFFHFVNHWNNYMLHHSSVGIVEGIKWRPEESRTEVILGPTRHWTHASLWAAHWCYGLLVLCTLRRLSPARAEGFREFFEDLGFRYRRLTRADVKDVGRNDPCPCGSEKKFKHCHLLYVEA